MRSSKRGDEDLAACVDRRVDCLDERLVGGAGGHGMLAVPIGRFDEDDIRALRDLPRAQHRMRGSSQIPRREMTADKKLLRLAD